MKGKLISGLIGGVLGAAVVTAVGVALERKRAKKDLERMLVANKVLGNTVVIGAEDEETASEVSKAIKESIKLGALRVNPDYPIYVECSSHKSESKPADEDVDLSRPFLTPEEELDSLGFSNAKPKDGDSPSVLASNFRRYLEQLPVEGEDLLEENDGESNGTSIADKLRSQRKSRK